MATLSINLWKTNETILEEYTVYKNNQIKPRNTPLVNKKKKKGRKHSKNIRRNIARISEKNKYVKYLESKHWEDKRKEFYTFLKKSGLPMKCDLCGSRKRLNIHHMTYDNIGCEDMHDLQLLCQMCHMEEHNIIVP